MVNIYLDDFHNANKIISNVSEDLSCLGRSFENVGNDKIANELYQYSLDLSAAVGMLKKALSDKLQADLADTYRSANEALKFGMEFAKKIDDGYIVIVDKPIKS